MRTVRRLLYRDIVGSVLFVALAFLALFFFVDLVNEIGGAGRRGYTSWHAVLVTVLEMPGNLYELLPISVLIGTIFSLARLAQTSQFTILRTGGLGPGQALGLLAALGAAFALATFVVGDYVAPAAERQAQQIKIEAAGGRQLGRTGAWLKDSRVEDGRERGVAINVQRVNPAGDLQGIRIFVFDDRQRLVERLTAATAHIDDDAVWHLRDVQRSRWPAPAAPGTAPDAPPTIDTQPLAELRWPSSLRADVVAAAVMPASTMSTVELWRYAQHLSVQDQEVQRYAIQFWKKALYPVACLVMAALALPFAYLNARTGGISLKVFGGVMLGTSFMLLNSLSGHLGLLRDWTPWLAAALPGTVYLLLSLAAFAWLVRYR